MHLNTKVQHLLLNALYRIRVKVMVFNATTLSTIFQLYRGITTDVVSSYPSHGVLTWGVLDTTLCYKVCQWLAADWLFSLGTPVSFAQCCLGLWIVHSWLSFSYLNHLLGSMVGSGYKTTSTIISIVQTQYYQNCHLSNRYFVTHYNVSATFRLFYLYLKSLKSNDDNNKRMIL
jgi:hypothetical protein